jgi:transcriptional regulator with XRE-family HTH domain
MSTLFADRLRAARELRGIGQSQLAEKAGLPPSAINHFEQDRRSPSFDNLKRLANALEVTTDYLLGRTGEPGLSGPTAQKVFRNAEKLTGHDLESLALIAEALANKAQGSAAGKGKDHGKKNPS